MERYLIQQVRKDLAKKMVFLGGPRQVGKTTLAKNLVGAASGYLNWDIDEDRERILTKKLPDSKLIVFDEIHKYRKWRNYLKGLYDQFGKQRQILVTGSARLDFYRFGGDSLQGRYHYLRLHPLSLAELAGDKHKDFATLLKLGGFPEPYFEGSPIEARRWSREYRTRLIREEIQSIERLEDLGSLELLVLRLPELVGSPLSVNGLKEDLQLNHQTVSRWLRILERFYFIFFVPPFGAPKLKAVKKAQKHYHFDWSLITDQGSRFENLVGSHLLKWVHYKQDCEGLECELRYFRDIEGREVDFIVTENRKPIIAVECKVGDSDPSPHLKYFHDRFPTCRCVQVWAHEEKAYTTPKGLEGMPATQFLKDLI